MKPKPKRKPAGYSIKESQLAKIMMIECAIRHNVNEISLIQSRYLCIENRLQKLRNEIKCQ